MASSFSRRLQTLLWKAIKIRKDDYMTVLLGIMLIVVGTYLVCNGGDK